VRTSSLGSADQVTTRRDIGASAWAISTRHAWAGPTGDDAEGRRQTAFALDYDVSAPCQQVSENAM